MKSRKSFYTVVPFLKKVACASLVAALGFGSLPISVAAQPQAPGAIVTVTTPVDNLDAAPNCAAVIGIPPPLGADGATSLREAICAANNTPGGPHTIHFNIPPGGPQIINVGAILPPPSPLPTIIQPMTIDGTTQPGPPFNTPIIVLDGTATAGLDGLTINAGNTLIMGLVIRFFQGSGIVINGPNGGNTLQSNYIGVDLPGLMPPVPNLNGVKISNSSGNVIGGQFAGMGNTISGNIGNGIEILGTSSTGNKIQGNNIGADFVGQGPCPNQGSGIYINGAPHTTIGGANPGEGNVISFNGGKGIFIENSTATNTMIYGNSIGTNIFGIIDAGNSSAGVYLNNSPGNLIGGIFPSGAGNVISGNDWNGVVISGTQSVNNQVVGNKIGTDLVGATAIGNTGSGIYIHKASNNTVGLGSIGGNNTISGNTDHGVIISGTQAANNKIIGNEIGTDVNGTVDLGNSDHGVFINNAPSNIVGRTAALEQNLISGNDGNGIYIFGSNAYTETVQHNWIGVDVSLNPTLGNSLNGILIQGASYAAIGGTGPSEGNTIAGNGQNGVCIQDAASTATRNKVSANSIFNNSSLGIDLGNDGVTLNDSQDHDIGPNMLQNYPIIYRVTSALANTYVFGTLNSLPNTTFTIELYVSNVCDASGYGEGPNYLGTTTATTNASGEAIFSLNAPVPTASGYYVTALAIDPQNNTSEFSTCRLIYDKELYLPIVKK